MAATIPVKISPLPPLAIPGLPVVLMAMRPSGSAIRVRHPFSTRVTEAPLQCGGPAPPDPPRPRDAHARQPGHFAWVRGQDHEPVITVPLARLRGQRIECAGINDDGHLGLFSRPGKKSTASSSWPMPGPIAMTDFFSRTAPSARVRGCDWRFRPSLLPAVRWSSAPGPPRRRQAEWTEQR